MPSGKALYRPRPPQALIRPESGRAIDPVIALDGDVEANLEQPAHFRVVEGLGANRLVVLQPSLGVKMSSGDISV